MTGLSAPLGPFPTPQMVAAGGSLQLQHMACICGPGDGIWGWVSCSETPCSPLSHPSCAPRPPCTPLSVHVPPEPLTVVSGLSHMGLLRFWPGLHSRVLRAGEGKGICGADSPSSRMPLSPTTLPIQPELQQPLAKGRSRLGRAEGQLEATGELSSQPENKILVLSIPWDWHAAPPAPAQPLTVPRDPQHSHPHCSAPQPWAGSPYRDRGLAGTQRCSWDGCRCGGGADVGAGPGSAQMCSFPEDRALTNVPWPWSWGVLGCMRTSLPHSLSSAPSRTPAPHSSGPPCHTPKHLTPSPVPHSP